MPNKQSHILWIGGTSALTETYFSTQAQAPTLAADCWTLVGRSKRPSWISSQTFIPCDLTIASEVDSLLSQVAGTVTHVIISLRPPLVTVRTNQQAGRYASRLSMGLQTFLKALPQQSVRVLHISSIAAIGHLSAQHVRGLDTSLDPPSSALNQPYDWFKRRCEEIISSNCETATHIRLGAIFSDSASCIQCRALALQAWSGAPLLSVKIDCNSSANVATLLTACLVREKPLRPLYYYTRPLLFPQPVPYGMYLREYKKAYEIPVSVWIPQGWVTLFCQGFHWLALWLGYVVPYLDSVDYLLQVTRTEHTFDNQAVADDFPNLVEESIYECFLRRRRRRQQQQQQR